MQSISISVLEPIKLPLVKKLYKTHYPSTKPKKDELIITANNSDGICGLLRLRSIEEFRLLTGMMVIPDYRGSGIGKQLLDYCATTQLNNNDYCFALAHLENYYAQHGFKVITAEDLPNSLKMAYQRYTQHGKTLIPMHFIAKVSSK